jgi:uncharacterized iron-regulated membrane protein
MRERVRQRPFRETSVRRAMFQVHLWSGIVLSLYILVICVTGSAIVFRRDLDKTLCPPAVTVQAGPHRLSTAELTAKAHARYPRFDPGQITVRGARGPNAPVEILFSGRGAQLDRLFDPYTGHDLADAIGCEPHFVTSLAAFHDHLGGGQTGLLINGLGAVAVTLLSLSGALVWWPGRHHLWRAMTVRAHGPLHRLMRELHGALGFWLVLLVLLWTLTGIYFAFPRPFNALADFADAAGVPTLSVDDAIAAVVRLHFGRAFGYGIEVLWAALGLLPVALVLTGIITWWHRVLRKGAR